MKEETKQKVRHEAEVDALRELFFAKFEATANEMEFFKKLSKLQPAEADSLTLWWVFCFAAESSISAGQNKEQFLESITAAFDESAEEVEEEEEDDEDGDEGEEDDVPESHEPIVSVIKPASSVEDLIKNPLGSKDDGGK